MDEQLIDEVAQHGVIYNRQKYYLNGGANGGKYETKDEAWQLIAMKLRTDGEEDALLRQILYINVALLSSGHVQEAVEVPTRTLRVAAEAGRSTCLRTPVASIPGENEVLGPAHPAAQVLPPCAELPNISTVRQQLRLQRIPG